MSEIRDMLEAVFALLLFAAVFMGGFYGFTVVIAFLAEKILPLPSPFC